MLLSQPLSSEYAAFLLPVLPSESRRSVSLSNYIELDGPTFDPLFVKYVRDAFAPVGLMIDLWGTRNTDVWGPRFAPGQTVKTPVMVKNDSGRT